MNTFKNIIPGLLLTSFIALLSIYFSTYIAIGSIAIAIIVGFILNNLFSNKLNSFEKGISFSEQTILSVAIILLGSYIDIKVLNSISVYTVLLLILIITISIILCYLIGKFFGLSNGSGIVETAFL